MVLLSVLLATPAESMSTFGTVSATKRGSSLGSSSSAAPIKLVALDLDGTTLNSHHMLTEKTKSVLRSLSSRGVIICLATGRGLDESFVNYLKELALPQVDTPIVTYNGAIGAIMTRKQGDGGIDFARNIIYTNPIPKEKTKLLIEFAGVSMWCSCIGIYKSIGGT